MSVLVKIEVLHKNLAEMVLNSNNLSTWRPSWISQNVQGFKLTITADVSQVTTKEEKTMKKFTVGAGYTPLATG